MSKDINNAIKDFQQISDLLRLFDYKSDNLTQEQFDVIEKIDDIVAKYC